MLDLKIFRSQALNIGLLIRFMGNFVMAGTIFILPFFLEMVKGYPIEEIGLLLAVPSLIVVFTSPLAGSLADRFGERRISLIGVLLMASGCWFISTFNAQLTVPIYITGITVYGLGIGVFQSSNNSAIMGATPQESLSTASGLLALSRMLGEVCGVPLMGTVFSFVIFSNASLTSGGDVTHAPPEALVLGLQTTFRIVACVLIASVILITLFERSKQEPTQTQ
jgi:MFS family permease